MPHIILQYKTKYGWENLVDRRTVSRKLLIYNSEKAALDARFNFRGRAYMRGVDLDTKKIVFEAGEV